MKFSCENIGWVTKFGGEQSKQNVSWDNDNIQVIHVSLERMLVLRIFTKS